MKVKKQQLGQDIEQQTGSKLGKWYVKAIYCHSAYLTYMQGASCKMLGWYSHLFKNFPQFVVIYTVKGFRVINKAEVDVLLEFSRFFDDPMKAGNLISDSSAFSKSSLNTWNFTVHILLKPHLENFENYFASV